MSLLLAVLGCAHQVTWQVQPLPEVRLPSTELAVLAEERACKGVADELAESFAARPGVVVRPSAATRVLVRGCDEAIQTVIEMESTYPGIVYDTKVYRERRRYTLRGTARADMLITRPGADAVALTATAERTDRGPWVTDGELDVPHGLALRSRMQRDVAWELADKIAPLPETIRRTLYRDPEPGTARQLHNAAVDAERAGQLDEALRLAREAYAADPTGDALAYIESLQSHAARVGYALKQ